MIISPPLTKCITLIMHSTPFYPQWILQMDITVCHLNINGMIMYSVINDQVKKVITIHPSTWQSLIKVYSIFRKEIKFYWYFYAPIYQFITNKSITLVFWFLLTLWYKLIMSKWICGITMLEKKTLNSCTRLYTTVLRFVALSFVHTKSGLSCT